MGTEKKDKRVYHYRSAFMQPTWIQKISDRQSLPNAIKLSTIGWTAFLHLVYNWLVENFVTKVIPIPLPFWLGFGTPPLWLLGILMADFTIEQQGVFRFLRDYLRFYWHYGRRRKKQTVNDGLLYYKPSYILKKEGKISEVKK